MPKRGRSKAKDWVFDGKTEYWHNSCGSLAGRTRAEVLHHLAVCWSRGESSWRKVHSHGSEKGTPKPGEGYTLTLTFKKKLLGGKP
jgi:hypothetical protein